MTEKLDQTQHERLLTPAIQTIMNALRQAGGEARLVGGAVRDAVMGRPLGDIDLAATLDPARVMAILKKAGIKTVATGLAHGTVTAVIDHTGYEITTLRRDVETDGRHAKVEFTDDWRTDAARRDFTFNALYADADGVVYDYFGGIADARAGHVRFIGDARARIREDVLRILRFFRFYAWFGREGMRSGDADAAALAACRDLADLMPRLSAERVAREVLKLLAAPDPLPAWQLMINHHIVPHFLPQAVETDRLRHLLENEKLIAASVSPLVRLAALLPVDRTDQTAALVARKLKLSGRDADTLSAVARLSTKWDSTLNAKAIRRMIYEFGAENCRAALPLGGHDIAATWHIIDNWENPVFPIRGEDIVKLGIPAGPRIGDILRAVEQWWIESDFHADREACLKQAAQYGKNH